MHANFLSSGGENLTLSHHCEKKLEAALPRARDALLLSHLSALAQFALLLPSVFEERSDTVITFIVKEFVMKASPPLEAVSSILLLIQHSIDTNY